MVGLGSVWIVTGGFRGIGQVGTCVYIDGYRLAVQQVGIRYSWVQAGVT